jgi:hypothetical protein
LKFLYFLENQNAKVKQTTPYLGARTKKGRTVMSNAQKTLDERLADLTAEVKDGIASRTQFDRLFEIVLDAGVARNVSVLQLAMAAQRWTSRDDNGEFRKIIMRTIGNQLAAIRHLSAEELNGSPCSQQSSLDLNSNAGIVLRVISRPRGIYIATVAAAAGMTIQEATGALMDLKSRGFAEFDPQTGRGSPTTEGEEEACRLRRKLLEDGSRPIEKKELDT